MATMKKKGKKKTSLDAEFLISVLVFRTAFMQQRLVTERRVGIGRKSIYALGVRGVGEGGDVLFSGFWGVLLFLGCFLGVFFG